MRIDENGRCDAAIWVPSPNFDARPESAAIELLVIHNISLPPGEFGGPWIDALFQNRLDPGAHPYFQEIAGLEVSAHFLIRRDGELRQYVATIDRAWHAGVSSWMGRERCNDFSIGIELEGTEDSAFSGSQYAQLSQLTRQLQRQYPIRDIAGHRALAPGRKTDPGAGFDWARYRSMI